MGILRVQKTEKYSIIANDCFADQRLSYRAVGLLCYLLSKPNDWTVRSSELSASHTEGRDAVLATLKELREYGYITLDKGFGSVNYTVHEVSVAADSQEPGNQGADNQGAEKPTLLKTELDKGLKKPRTEIPREVESVGNQTTVIATDSGSRNEPKRPHASPSLLHPMIVQFIQSYPSHRRTGTALDIRDAWEKATSEIDPERLFAMLERYRASWKWTNEPQYIPGIVKWLGEGRWKVEPEPAPYTPPPAPGHLHPKEGQTTMIWGVDY
jgi:hypothetical protein